ncbi:MAG: hypothetical protein EOP11_24010, partial [Proteobacteria bacterium]
MSLKKGLQRAFVVAALGALSACAPGSSSVYPLKTDLSQVAGRPAVIFLHGYYGSALKDARTGARLFIKPWQTLMGKRPIALHSESLGTRPSPDLEVEGLFGNVTVLPYLYGLTVYSPLINSLSLNGANFVVPFAYDWREDLQPTAANLAALVESLKKAGAPRVSIVAHSMGGLVAAYYLGYGSQSVEKARLNWEGAKAVSRVVFLGTPFRGAISILRNMQHGTGYPWNADLLEPETVSSWKASYYLLPYLDPKLIGGDGRPLPLDLADPTLWADRLLGFYQHPVANPRIMEARAEYTKRQVALSRRFQELAQLKGGSAPPASLKILNVTGEGKPTLAKGYAPEEEKR